MLFYILILFGLYGWVEFEALIFIGSEIGGLASFLGIFVTAFIGMGLLRSQGRAVLAKWQANLTRGEVETASLASGLSLLVGALLMLLPGYVTDAMGILCFIPGLRFLIGRALLTRFKLVNAQNIFGNRFTSGFNTASDRYDNTAYSNDRAPLPRALLATHGPRAYKLMLYHDHPHFGWSMRWPILPGYSVHYAQWIFA